MFHSRCEIEIITLDVRFNAFPRRLLVRLFRSFPPQTSRKFYAVYQVHYCTALYPERIQTDSSICAYLLWNNIQVFLSHAECKGNKSREALLNRGILRMKIDSVSNFLLFAAKSGVQCKASDGGVRTNLPFGA